ncbi:MAG: hypothetical protein ACE363_14675 [Alphaproteobacteria bacterium]
MHRLFRSGLWAFSIALMAVPVSASFAQSPETAAQEWRTVEGTVTFADRTTIVVLSRNGREKVQTLGWNWHAEHRLVSVGDNVKIEGFQTPAGPIEARVLYLKDRNTYYYNMGENGEDVTISLVPGPVTLVWLELTGIVEATTESGLVINTGRREVAVDTSQMPSDPLRRQGKRDVEIGDVVTIAGKIEYHLFDQRPLVAAKVENNSRSGELVTQQ